MSMRFLQEAEDFPELASGFLGASSRTSRPAYQCAVPVPAVNNTRYGVLPGIVCMISSAPVVSAVIPMIPTIRSTDGFVAAFHVPSDS